MVDISKCSGEGCKVKEKCYRFTVKGNEYWQVYSDFHKTEKDKEGKCEYFWYNKK